MKTKVLVDEGDTKINLSYKIDPVFHSKYLLEIKNKYLKQDIGFHKLYSSAPILNNQVFCNLQDRYDDFSIGLWIDLNIFNQIKQTIESKELEGEQIKFKRNCFDIKWNK